MMVPRKTSLLIGILILSSLLISSCGDFSLADLLPGSGSTSEAEALVEVTFYVRVPLNTPTEDTIYLSLLDEVSGLGVNASAHPMEPAPGEAITGQDSIYTSR